MLLGLWVASIRLAVGRYAGSTTVTSCFAALSHGGLIAEHHNANTFIYRHEVSKVAEVAGRAVHRQLACVLEVTEV